MAGQFSLTLKPYFQAYGQDGLALVGGKVEVYEQGTSTPKTSYSDAAQTVENSWPVVLDALGQASIYISGPYKMVVKDSAGVVLYTADNIIGITGDIVAWVVGGPPIMGGATPSAAGTAGAAPAPAAGQQFFFLRGDGTWAGCMSPIGTQMFL